MHGRSLDLSLADRFYTRISKSNRCQYCGEHATTEDHFVPISVAAHLIRSGIRPNNLFLLPACLECNVLAGDAVFDSIEEKRKFIQDKIEKKYKAILKIPQWKYHELDELGYNLRNFVNSGIGQFRILLGRLEWQGEKIEEKEENVNIVALNSTRLASGKSSAGSSVSKNGTTKRKSSSLSMLRASGMVLLRSEQTVEELDL